MVDPVASPQVVSSGSHAPGRGRRLLRGLFLPLRFAYRRPGRSAILLGVFTLILAAGAAVGLWAWFDYHLRSARREVERGHNAAAARHLNSCRQVQPEHREVLLLAARVARRGGNWSEADGLLDVYWKRYGDDDPLVFERLLLRATRGELETTASLLAARIQNGGPEGHLAREALISGLLYRFRWPEAERAIQNWRATEPDDTTALLLLGKLQEQRSLIGDALNSFRQVVERDGEHDEARLRMTTLLLQQFHAEDAAPHLAYLRERLPENRQVKVQWVRVLALQGRHEEARAALDDYLRQDPNFPQALAERGRIALTDGDDRLAEECLGRAVRLEPGNVTTRHQYALALTRNGKSAEAAREQQTIEQLKADSERITQLISGPLQVSPNNPEIHYEIAMIALRAGQPVEALRWLQSALQVGPDHQPTHLALAGFYHESGQPALAAKHQAIAQGLSKLKRP